MSTQTTIQMPLFFFFRNVLLSFLTLLTASMDDTIIFTKNVENHMHICINTIRPIMRLYVPSSE